MAAAIGFRVKSGWATAVLLAGPAVSPHVVDLRRVDLSDPRVPRSRQPYHAGFGVAQTNATNVEHLVRLVHRYGRRSVNNLVSDYRTAGRELRGVAIVVGSDIDPETITNPHIRAHAFEGRLFRTVVEAAVRRRRLACSVIVERNLYATAAQILNMSEDRLTRAATELGPRDGRRWRAEEKVATVAAWLVLAKPRPRPVARTHRTAAA